MGQASADAIRPLLGKVDTAIAQLELALADLEEQAAAKPANAAVVEPDDADARKPAVTGGFCHARWDASRCWHLSSGKPERLVHRDTAARLRPERHRWRDPLTAVALAGFTRFIDDGRLGDRHNAVERATRPLALGHKDWLFAGSDAVGQRAAAIYSLIETVKLNGLDPEANLRHVLERIADHPANRAAQLLPWNIGSSGRIIAPGPEHHQAHA